MPVQQLRLNGEQAAVITLKFLSEWKNGVKQEAGGIRREAGGVELHASCFKLKKAMPGFLL